MSQDFILEAQGLTKQFRGFYAVKDVNLKIQRHTIHALIGPNGAGKTTCFNLLTTFLKPTQGTILFNGRHIETLPQLPTWGWFGHFKFQQCFLS